jgi:hypothetical protein
MTYPTTAAAFYPSNLHLHIIGPVFYLPSIRHVSSANVTSLAPTFSTLAHCQVTFDGLLNSCSLA